MKVARIHTERKLVLITDCSSATSLTILIHTNTNTPIFFVFFRSKHSINGHNAKSWHTSIIFDSQVMNSCIHYHPYVSMHKTVCSYLCDDFDIHLNALFDAPIHWDHTILLLYTQIVRNCLICQEENIAILTH